MKSKKEAFASLMADFLYHFDTVTVFDDFLTLTVAAFGHNPRIGKSNDEDLYLQTIGKYKHHKLKDHFPKLLACLVMEMEEQIGSQSGNDVLGTYYEQNIFKKGSQQFFTPWHICEFMSSCLTGDAAEEQLRIIDPCCGSGRLLLCGAKNIGKQHHYYGIDIDHTCVKMTAINLFLNGVFHAEVMWADSLSNDDFRMSYELSFLPFGIFRISEKEKSPLWHSYKSTFIKADGSSLLLPSDDPENRNTTTGNQLRLF